VIVVVLAVTVTASLLKSQRDPDARAHAGRLRTRRQEEDLRSRHEALRRPGTERHE
jgi:tellurite resistance protein TerC